MDGTEYACHVCNEGTRTYVCECGHYRGIHTDFVGPCSKITLPPRPPLVRCPCTEFVHDPAREVTMEPTPTYSAVIDPDGFETYLLPGDILTLVPLND